MQTTLQREDLELLGYQVLDELNSDGWRLFRARVNAGLEAIESLFLYLKTDCTVDQLEAAAKNLRGRQQTIYALTPASLKLVRSTVERTLPREAKILEADRLIWQQLRQVFSDYLNALKEDVPREPFFVTPRQEGSPDLDLGKELVSYLSGKSQNMRGQLVVVKAPAGVGKTTVARHIVLTLTAKSDAAQSIPIFVESKHWRKLHLESVSGLWEIIQNSLQAYSSASRMLSWEHFQHALRCGYLTFVFDGFDELCGHKSGHFDAKDVLSTLAEICRESDARILVTTRTLYWDQAIGDAIPANVSQIELASFQKQQALQYFDQVFKEDRKALDRAKDFYSRVVASSHRPTTPGGGRVQFVNLPFCVSLIAELVKNSDTTTATLDGRHMVEQLVLAICDREVQRQGLVTPPRQQVQAFEEIVLDKSFLRDQNPEFEIDLLAYAGFSESELPSLKSHALLQSADVGKLKFRFEFLPALLRATFLSRAINAADERGLTVALGVMQQEANGKGFILEQLLDLIEPLNWRLAFTKVLSIVPLREREARSFLLHLAKGLLKDTDCRQATKAELTENLFQLFSSATTQGKTIGNMTFFGPLSDFDFRGRNFRNCVFNDTSFANSEANHQTRFENCTFRGVVEIPDKRDWKGVSLVDCRLEPPSNLCWEAVTGKVPGTVEDSVLDSLSYALVKFWHNGHFKENVRKNDWGKGSINHSVHREVIRDGLVRFGLVTEEVTSGVAEGVYRFNRAHLPSLQRFMDSRQRTGAILELYNYVMSKV